MESSFLNPAKVIAALHIDEGMRVADFSGAGGFFTRAAARAVGSGVVWTVDSNADLLTRIKNLGLAEGLHNIEIVRGNIEAESGSHLPGSSFDLVLATNIFFHLEHKSRAIEEMSRVLKHGGRVLVTDWLDSFGGLGPHHEHVVEKQKILKLFEAEGFALESEVPAGAYHWGFVVRKKRK
ncbi:methyltransferase domain-containing protein [Candidatus Parcubacteria bacterium]|nr:methyltransferase domain-containing protein [Candidatus Parcubacteria bacterium]